jgi:IS5 family transposase
MFKAILLGQWYSLSDNELEEALKVRLDFMLFTGFELTDEIPDGTTLCRFRNKLIEKKRLKKLLKEVNNQLEQMGIKVKECEGAVIDATIIESSARPKTVIEEDKDNPSDPKIEYSKDKDARWVKKGKRSYFGYRGYIRTDSKDGYIEHVHVKPANESEVNELGESMEGSKAKRAYADKAYDSQDNRALLKTAGYKDGVMVKAKRGKPLTHWQKLKNKLISAKRFIVERTFGTLKRQLKIGRSSYKGRSKVEAQLLIKALCYNLLKASKVIHLA